MYVPTTTLVPFSTSVVADLMHFSRCFNMLFEMPIQMHRLVQNESHVSNVQF